VKENLWSWTDAFTARKWRRQLGICCGVHKPSAVRCGVREQKEAMTFGVRVVASGSAIIWMCNPICIMKGLNSKGFMRSSRTIMKTIDKVSFKYQRICFTATQSLKWCCHKLTNLVHKKTYSRSSKSKKLNSSNYWPAEGGARQ